MTIIDTPGYGDTRGIKKDKEITHQIKAFFEGGNGVNTLHAICFFVKSSDARLTPTQRYIFDSVLVLFGKDIADNIFLLITFADGQLPPVLKMVKEADIPFKESYKFNNSVLYVNSKNDDNDEDDDEDNNGLSKLFWKRGMGNIKKFMDKLGNVDAQSLTLTVDILNQRRQLEFTIEQLTRNNNTGLLKLEELKADKRALEDVMADIERNRNFTYVVQDQRVVTEPTQQMSVQQMFNRCVVDYLKVQLETLKLTQEARDTLAKLRQITLKPVNLSVIDYIDILIKNEEDAVKPGWKERVDELQSLRKRSEQVKLITEKEQSDAEKVDLRAALEEEYRKATGEELENKQILDEILRGIGTFE